MDDDASVQPTTLTKVLTAATLLLLSAGTVAADLPPTVCIHPFGC